MGKPVNKKCTCEKCGKTYGCRQHLHRHRLKCIKLQAYECLKCGKQFPRKDNRDRHSRKCSNRRVVSQSQVLWETVY